MKILVTGAAGFIGSHLAAALLARGDTVVGLDNFNDYYDPRLKRANVTALISNPRFMLEEDMPPASLRRRRTSGGNGWSPLLSYSRTTLRRRQRSRNGQHPRCHQRSRYTARGVCFDIVGVRQELTDSFQRG